MKFKVDKVLGGSSADGSHRVLGHDKFGRSVDLPMGPVTFHELTQMGIQEGDMVEYDADTCQFTRVSEDSAADVSPEPEAAAARDPQVVTPTDPKSEDATTGLEVSDDTTHTEDQVSPPSTSGSPLTKLDTTSLMDTAVFVAQQNKQWSGHNRSDTVGASEIGQCARKIVFDKHDKPWDSDYTQDYGALERGHNMEDWAVTRMQQHLDTVPNVDLIWATDEGQQTMVDGAQSSTPDGLFVLKPGEKMQLPDVPDLAENSIYNELKSIDPRAFEYLMKPKEAHFFQVQQGMDLVRRLTEYKPEWAIITYINASFFSDQRQFAVKFDEELAIGLRSRASDIMYTYDLDNLPPPEGRIQGGKDCQYCPFVPSCIFYETGSLPEKGECTDDLKVLGQLQDMAHARAIAKQDETNAANLRKEIEHNMVETLRELGDKKAKGDWGSVSVRTAHSPGGVDVKAMEADGMDIDKYRTAGTPYVRLDVRLKKDQQAIIDDKIMKRNK